MNPNTSQLREQAKTIWQAAIEAVQPERLLGAVLHQPKSNLAVRLRAARRILVVGAGKAGGTMSAAVEHGLSDCLEKVTGVVNVPADQVRLLQRIILHPGRPAGVNQPTAEGVAGARQMLTLVQNARPDDVVLCLLSGGGSALLPLPASGVPLADKQHLTEMLHACGATIAEMNAVRKHLSDIKGGRLAQQCQAGSLFSLIISDVVGDPLDVIASGPTAPDPTTFADALAVLEHYKLCDRVATSILDHLRAGLAGRLAETPKQLEPHVHNMVLGNNQHALMAAGEQAGRMGYTVLNLGSRIEGETVRTAATLADIIRSIVWDGVPVAPPVCVLSGGETTVSLPADHGKGGRNQEFALAMACRLSRELTRGVVIVCAGSDGEDGPTDAAGAIVDHEVVERAASVGLDPPRFLGRHDAYNFLNAADGLLRTGPTGTNVMDIRVMLVPAEEASTSGV